MSDVGEFRIMAGRHARTYDAGAIWADPIVEVNGRRLAPGEPFVIRAPYRCWLRWGVLEYRRDAGALGIERLDHFRWWWFTRGLALWWLRRTTDIPRKG